jgi:hypothetical protein
MVLLFLPSSTDLLEETVLFLFAYRYRLRSTTLLSDTATYISGQTLYLLIVSRIDMRNYILRSSRGVLPFITPPRLQS